MEITVFAYVKINGSNEAFQIIYFTPNFLNKVFIKWFEGDFNECLLNFEVKLHRLMVFQN